MGIALFIKNPTIRVPLVHTYSTTIGKQSTDLPRGLTSEIPIAVERNLQFTVAFFK